MPVLTVELPDSTIRAIHRTAQEREETLSRVVQTALDGFVQDHQSEGGLDTISERRVRIQIEAAAWRNLSETERGRFGSGFAAVFNEQVVDYDVDRRSLLRRVRRRLGDVPVLITPTTGSSPREFYTTNSILDKTP